MSSHLRWASEEWDENIWPTLLPGGSHCSLSSDHSVNRWNVRTRLWYHRSHLFPSLIVYHWTLKYTKYTKLCTVSPKCSMYIEVVPDVVLSVDLAHHPSRAAVVMVWARLSNRTATHRTLRGRNVSRVLLFMILTVPCSDGTNLQPVDVPCCHETCMSCRYWTIPVMLSWNYFYSLNPLLQIDCKFLSKNWKSTLQYFLIIKSFM